MSFYNTFKKHLKNFKLVKKLLSFFNNNIKYQHLIVNEQYSNDEKMTIFTVKSIGMNIFPRYLATELANDDEILKNFHPADIKRIMKAYYSDSETFILENIKFRITSKTILNGKQMFTVSSINDDFSKKMNPIEILNNKEILYSLSKEDIADVCYEAGSESFLNEIISIKSSKESHKVVRLIPTENKIKDK